MYKRTVSVLYVISTAFQAIFTLGWQIALGFGIGYIAVNFWSAPEWIYVPLILLGVLTGFITMIRFLLTAMKSLDAIEAQHERDRQAARERTKRNKNSENNQ